MANLSEYIMFTSLRNSPDSTKSIVDFVFSLKLINCKMNELIILNDL